MWQLVQCVFIHFFREKIVYFTRCCHWAFGGSLGNFSFIWAVSWTIITSTMLPKPKRQCRTPKKGLQTKNKRKAQPPPHTASSDDGFVTDDDPDPTFNVIMSTIRTLATRMAANEQRLWRGTTCCFLYQDYSAKHSQHYTSCSTWLGRNSPHLRRMLCSKKQ